MQASLSSHKKCIAMINIFRELSFLILGTGAEDFGRVNETFLHYFMGVRKSSGQCFGVPNGFA